MLGRFTQADTLVPSPLNPQSLNRFSYTLNNPVRYTDPTGHMEVDPGGGTSGEDDEEHAAEEGEYVITPENVDEYLPPADTGSDQTPDHDDVQEALENPGTYESETQIAVAMFEKGYNPYTDARFGSFAEYDQANLIWYFTLWTYQKRQDAGISGGGDDFWALFAAGSAMAGGRLADRARAVHGQLDPIAQNMRTTAVVSAKTQDGTVVRLVASSEYNLTSAQKAALLSGEIAVSGAGHAEVKALRYASANGLTPLEVAASRPICSACAAEISAAGATAVTGLK